jgi:hypothetical protein
MVRQQKGGKGEGREGENMKRSSGIRSYQPVNGEERPQYVVCGEVLANSSSIAGNLHKHLANEPIQIF